MNTTINGNFNEQIKVTRFSKFSIHTKQIKFYFIIYNFKDLFKFIP